MDDECWTGADVDPNEVRVCTILWEGNSALIFVSIADGYASYGRLNQI